MCSNRQDSIGLIDMQNCDMANVNFITGGWSAATGEATGKKSIQNIASLNMLSYNTCKALIKKMLKLNTFYGLVCAKSKEIFDQVTMFIIFYN